jgi:hypothetical protein
LILGKLGLRREAFPFDFSRVTFDGVSHFIANGFDKGFFPPGPPPYRPECVGIWVLFRGQHTAFAHFDLNSEKVQDAFRRKIARWNHLLDGRDPVTFFRTVSSRCPGDELRHLAQFHDVVCRRNPHLDYRVVLVVHDQGIDGPPAVQFASPDPKTSLWALQYTEDESHTLFDRSCSGYAEIVAKTIDEESWPSPTLAPRLPEEYTLNGKIALRRGEELTWIGLEQLTSEKFPWREHNNIALIDGVASVGGTCVGFGSTLQLDGRCHFCANDDYHKAGKPFRSERPFTDEEDELILVHLYRIVTGGDKVEAIEQLAHEMGRGAFEVICRIQFLTNSSTKLTEGLYPND